MWYSVFSIEEATRKKKEEYRMEVVIGATRVVSRRVASELEEYAQSKDPRVLDNLLFLCERMYRLILAVEDHGGGRAECRRSSPVGSHCYYRIAS